MFFLTIYTVVWRIGADKEVIMSIPYPKDVQILVCLPYDK